MSTDPLGDAIGRSEPAQPAPGAASPPAGAAPAQPGPPTEPPAPEASPAGAYQAPSAYETQPPQAAWPEPEFERPLVERRPEILVGAALAGGFVAAQLLGRIRGR